MRFLLLAVAIALAVTPGCDQDGDTIYPTQEDVGPDGQMLPRADHVRVFTEAQSIWPLSLKAGNVRLVKEVREGTGPVAQPTRVMKVRFTAADEAGAPLGGGEVSFLYPPLDYNGQHGLAGGLVPDAFVNGLAGMRVGGERVFSLPVGQDADHGFMTRGSMHVVFTMPASGRVTFRVNLLDVCRPKVRLHTTYSLPANKTTGIVINGCD